MTELLVTDPGSPRGRELVAGLLADPCFLAVAFRSVRDLLDDIGPRSPALRALFAHWLLHLGRGPDEPGGALWVPLLLGAMAGGGYPTPAGGSGELARTLAELVTDRGGEIRTETDVVGIGVEGGAARVVVTAAGERFHARRAVVASVTPDQLYLRLLDGAVVPAQVREQARRYRFGRGVVQVHLALAEAPRFPDDRLAGAGQVVLSDGLDATAQAVTAAARGLLPVRPSVSLDVPSRVDPSRAPAGRATARLQILEVPARPRGDAAGEIGGLDGTWTDHAGERFADRVVAIADSHVPGLADAVLARSVVHSATLAAANPNTGPGDPYAGAFDALQGLWRPLPSQPGYQTPIPNLWTIGAATWPGGGVSGTSGDLVARALLATTALDEE